MRSVVAACLIVAVCAAQAVAAGTPRRAFVTTGKVSGHLGSENPGLEEGLAAGDAICRTQATVASLPNPSAYRAWLSDSTTDAYCHLRGQTGKKGSCQGSPQPAGPWYLVTGNTVLTGDLDDLTGTKRQIYRSFFRDQDNVEVVEEESYWTGTWPDGTATSSHCDDWANSSSTEFGTDGASIGSVQHWTNFDSDPCNVPKRLLCLETGESVEPAFGWTPATLAFVTSSLGTGDLSSWPDAVAAGAQGAAAGNAICRAHAARGRLPAPHSFFAWLSTSTDDAKDLLSGSGPIRRPDGIAVETTTAGLFVDGPLASLHVDEMGRYLSVPVRVWTGTKSTGFGWNDFGNEFHCEDWDSSEGVPNGRKGSVAYARNGWWTDSGWTGCSGGGALYCFSNTVVLFWDGFDATGDTRRWSDTGP